MLIGLVAVTFAWPAGAAALEATKAIDVPAAEDPEGRPEPDDEIATLVVMADAAPVVAAPEDWAETDVTRPAAPTVVAAPEAAMFTGLVAVTDVRPAGEADADEETPMDVESEAVDAVDAAPVDAARMAVVTCEVVEGFAAPDATMAAEPAPAVTSTTPTGEADPDATMSTLTGPPTTGLSAIEPSAIAPKPSINSPAGNDHQAGPAGATNTGLCGTSDGATAATAAATIATSTTITARADGGNREASSTTTAASEDHAVEVAESILTIATIDARGAGRPAKDLRDEAREAGVHIATSESTTGGSNATTTATASGNVSCGLGSYTTTSNTSRRASSTTGNTSER